MELAWRLRRWDRVLRAHVSRMRPHSPALLEASAPLLRIEYPGPAHSRSLLVFLPGIGDLAEDFERHGLVDELRRLHPSIHAVAVDAHYGYYHSRALFEHLTDDVLAAARSAGFERVWLCGISMGGFGAAAYAAHHAAHYGSLLAGLLLLAPYPGEQPMLQEIRAAGGLGHWEPQVAGKHDIFRSTWSWLRDQTLHSSSPAMTLWLGYGANDRFAPGCELLRERLPPERSVVLPGGHDWRTWRKLWRALLERDPFMPVRHE